MRVIRSPRLGKAVLIFRFDFVVAVVKQLFLFIEEQYARDLHRKS